MSNSTLDLLNQAISSQQSGSATPSKAMSEAFGNGGSVDIRDAQQEAELVSSSNGQQDTDSYLDSMLGTSQGTKKTTKSVNSKEPSTEQKDTETEGDSPDEAKSPETSPNVEFISVKSPDGRSQKIKIDYGDKKSIKNAYSLAAGARKWQVERDQLIGEVKSLKESSGKKAENFDLLDKVYQRDGVEGVIDFLAQDKGGFESFLENKIKEREWKSNATPEQIALHESKKAQRVKDQEMEELKKELQSIRDDNSKTREEAETSALKSQINPVFDKYRFSGKLGSPQEEHMLDKMLWNTAMSNLDEYPDDTDITPELIQKEFSAVSSSLRKIINKQVDSQVTKSVDQKKKSAMEQAQMQTLKGYSGDQSANEMRQMLKNPTTSNLTSLLTRVLSRK